MSDCIVNKGEIQGARQTIKSENFSIKSYVVAIYINIDPQHMTLGTGHYLSPGGGGLEENMVGARFFVLYQVGGLCISYHCLSVAFKNLKRKKLCFEQEINCRKMRQKSPNCTHFFQNFPRGACPWPRPTPLAPLKFYIHDFDIQLQMTVWCVFFIFMISLNWN